MGRPRKRRPEDIPNALAPASRRRASPTMQRSGSVSSSAPSTGPEIHSFQLGATPAPSFADHSFGFLDPQAGTPDMTFLDLIPGYYPDNGIPLATSPQPGCDSSQAFTASLPMAQDNIHAYADLAFLDPAFTTSSQGDNYDAYGGTPDLSAGSHTPYNSEPSYSPPPIHTSSSSAASSQYPAPDGHAAPAMAPEPLRPAPTVACPCLSSLYMALESLSNLPNNISAALRVTRQASKVAHNVLTCKLCSGGMFDLSKPPPMQCFQNMMLLATLVPSACNAYTAIVEMIDRECHLATQQDRDIHFSAREIGGPWDHQAFGGGVPPAEVLEFDNTDLAPHEWRRLMLAIVRLDVYGNTEERPSGLAGSPGLMGLADVITALDNRASKRHDLIDEHLAAGTLPSHNEHYMMTPRTCRPEDRNCVRVLEVARLALNNLVIA